MNFKIVEVDDYLVSFKSESLDDASFIKFLDNPEKLIKFHENLHGFINTNKKDKNILFQILENLKITSTKKLDLKTKIVDADVHHLLSSTTAKDDIYVDLAALRLSFLSSSHPSYQSVYQKVLTSDDEDFHSEVAQQIEWYINYENLLVGSVSFTNSLMIGVVKKVVEKNPSHRTFQAEPILEKVTSICDNNGIEKEQLLQTLQREDTFELNEERILELEPSVLLILKESQSKIASNVIEVFNNYYKNRSKDEWGVSFNDLNGKLFNQLKSINFVNWNHFALEVFDSLLLKIADDSIIDNNEIVLWLLSSFAKSERDLDNTLKSMRDRLIQNNNVTEEVFTLFIEPLLAFASLEDRASDVVRTIFKTELLDSDKCTKKMMDNSESIKTILSKSGKSKDDFRDGLKARISNESIQELSRELGFKIKPETNESTEDDS